MHLFMVQYYKRVTILVFTKFFYQARFLYWYWFLLITRHIPVSMVFCTLKIAIQAKSLFSKDHHKQFLTLLIFCYNVILLLILIQVSRITNGSPVQHVRIFRSQNVLR